MKKILFLLLLSLTSLISEDKLTNKESCIKSGKEFQSYLNIAKSNFDKKEFSSANLNFIMSKASLLMWTGMNCNSLFEDKDKIKKANIVDAKLIEKVSKLIEISKKLDVNTVKIVD